jgi:predicted secreted protein
MTSARISLALVVLLFISITAAHAGDFANLNFIGFSKDGRHLAFEEYGIQDGSGWAYSNFYFVDVVKNVYAAPSITIRIENDYATERQARTKAKLSAAASLRKLRIVERNVGTQVVSRLLTDVSANHYLSSDTGKTQTVEFAEMIASMYRKGDYELVMNPSEVKVKDCEYTDDQSVFKLELLLKDKDLDKTVVLQRDSALPKSRACPLSYAIQHVYLYENNIAVFLNTYHMGFEGPDMRYLVVTGKYK